MCTIDAEMDQPESRSFDFDIKSLVRNERGRIVQACLIILRAWHLVRDRELKALGLSPFGSFEEWSEGVRAPLIWLGEADPCGTQQAMRESDPERAAILKVMRVWEEAIGLERVVTVKDIIDKSLVVFDLQLTLLEISAERGSSRIVSNQRLGGWLGKVKGRVIGDRMIRYEGVRDGYPRYSLQEVG
jgi:putative DNA primase/helicase